MTRREFRIIAGQCTGSPENQATSRRKPSRRQFKTIHCGEMARSGPQIQAVTLKCIDKTDGTTIWEYGPGSLWRHHYGADAISGVVPNLTATLNKYAIAAGSYPTFNSCGNRNAATLAANVCEPLEVVKLDSLDGTTIESATLTGLFCDVITDTSVGLVNGQTMTNAAALSGGDFVIVGERVPFIEFVDFTSNTTTKNYILHAHGLRDGNVYLKTRTSNETITIPYNSDATAVETLFEATSDCTAATVTGGPWPLLPITVEATWSVSGGDISAIATTGTYTVTGNALDWEWALVYIAEDIEAIDVTINNLAVGVTFSFEFSIGNVFSYTSTGTDVGSFLTAMATAMATFATGEGADGAWESVASGLPSSISVTGNTIRIIYSSAIGIDPLVVTASGGEGATDTRRAAMCAASYDTGTGDMTAAVGYEFGYSEDRPTLRMFEDADENPAVTGLNVLGILSIGSGPSNAVVITPQLRGLGDVIKSSVVEAWTITGGAWSFEWQTFCNAEMAMPSIIPCESGYVICPINAKIFEGVRYRNAARIAVSDTTTVEFETNYASTDSPNNTVSTAMYDDTAGSYLSWGYDGRYTDPDRPNNVYRTNSDGSDTYVNGPLLRLGATAFGADGSSVFGIANGAVTRFAYVPETSVDHNFTIRFWPQPTVRSAEPQQFRFRFANNATTGWIDWYATTSEIITELLALLGENSDPTGFGSNVQAVFSDIEVDNNPVAAIERGLWFQFLTTNGFTSGSGYVPAEYFSTRPGDVSIELQTTTPFATQGIAAYDITDASLLWSRPFGTALIGGATVASPLYAWLQGDYVYAYGQLLENELP